MGAALTDQDPIDLFSAGKTGFTFASVNLKMILKFSAAINPIDAGSIAKYTFFQYIPDGLPEAGNLLLGQRAGVSEGMQPGKVQCFIDIDVP